jgi:hypothetical protein
MDTSVTLAKKNHPLYEKNQIIIILLHKLISFFFFIIIFYEMIAKPGCFIVKCGNSVTKSNSKDIPIKKKNVKLSNFHAYNNI